MTGRVLEFNDPAHRAVETLLPWFVNGTLEGGDLALVGRHLGECIRCQREVDSLRELQAAYAGSEMAPDAARSFRKLRPRVDESRAGWRIWLRLGTLRRFWRQTQPWARWAVAAQATIIVVLGTLLVSGSEPATLYRTLGAADASPHAAGGLVVVFDPNITEAELRRILRAVGARVADGPTGADAYVLDLPTERQAAALAALHAEHAVLLAERLGPGDVR